MSQTNEVLASLPEPLEVVVKTKPDVPIGYACSRCGVFFPCQGFKKHERVYSYEQAQAHCMTACTQCSGPIDKCYFLLCRACQSKNEDKKEETRFDKAQKLTVEQYEHDVLHWEGYVGDMGDGYFSELEVLIDYCEQEGCDVPEYVWACEPHDFQLHAESIIEQELERQDMYEDAYDHIGSKAMANLQAYFDVWVGEVKLRSWGVDYSRAILLHAVEGAEPGESAVG
jgi:hypothetical protein